jgi:hypothetical protein
MYELSYYSVPCLFTLQPAKRVPSLACQKGAVFPDTARDSKTPKRQRQRLYIYKINSKKEGGHHVEVGTTLTTPWATHSAEAWSRSPHPRRPTCSPGDSLTTWTVLGPYLNTRIAGYTRRHSQLSYSPPRVVEDLHYTIAVLANGLAFAWFGWGFFLNVLYTVESEELGEWGVKQFWG